jgi:hypothetical protein
MKEACPAGKQWGLDWLGGKLGYIGPVKAKQVHRLNTETLGTIAGS